MARTQYLAAKARARSKLLKARVAKRGRFEAPMQIPRISHGWPRGPIHAEFKSIDNDINNAVNSNGSVGLLNGCSRGSDINNRIGRTIIVKSIQISISSFATQATGLTQEHRFLLVYDKQPNGVLPGVQDMVDAITPWAMRNLDNRNRFIILMDTMHALASDLAAGTNGEGNPKIKAIKYYRRHNLKVQYNDGDDATIASINTGAIYLVSIGSRILGVTAGAVLGSTRVRFIDS